MGRVLIKNLYNKALDLSACQHSLLHCLLDSGLDWMHACGGKGRCTTCKVQVLEGMASLSALSPAEIRYRERNLLLNDERLSCQVRLLGDIVIQIPEESQLPHIRYSNMDGSEAPDNG